MTQKNPFADFFTQNDFSKAFENYQNMPFDLSDLLETQRKNAQAITEAQQRAIEGLQTIVQRQGEILSQIVEDNSKLAKEIMTDSSPEQKISKNAELFKIAYERSVKNLKDLAEIISKSNNQATEIINKRVSASMSEIQSSLDKAQKKAA